MNLVFKQTEGRTLSALLTLLIGVSVIGCSGDKSSPDSATKTAPDGAAATAPEAKETADAPKSPEAAAPEAATSQANKEMKKEAAPAPTKTEPKPEPKKTAPPAPAPGTSKTPTTGSSNLKPEVAVQAWFEGLAKGPTSVWDAFPASYQKDINDLVHLFSENMDDEVWNRSVGSIKKMSSILKAKKDILLDPDYLASLKMEKKEAEDAFDHIVGLLDTLTASDISSLERMKKFEGGKFLETTGAQFFAHIEPLADLASAKQGKEAKLSDIADTKVTLIEANGDTALLKIEVPGKEPKEQKFVKVEGKWVPADINPEKWKEQVKKAQENIAKLAPQMKANRDSALQTLAMLDGFLGKLEKVETKEELQAEVFAAMAPFMQMIQQLKPGAPSTAPPKASPTPPKATGEKKPTATGAPAPPEKKK